MPKTASSSKQSRMYEARFKLLGFSAFTFTLAMLLLGIRHYAYGGLQESPAAINQITNTAALSSLGGAFELVDHTGRVRTNKDFLGQYQLIYFGYSYCPDICPMALNAMTLALDNLGTLSREVVPIFITIDPERDTSSHLKTYKESFHPSLMALTGEKSQLQKAQKAFRVYAQKAESDGTMSDYLMDHSSLIYLLNRQGQCIALFSHTSKPQRISEKIKEVMAQEEGS